MSTTDSSPIPIQTPGGNSARPLICAMDVSFANQRKMRLVAPCEGAALADIIAALGIGQPPALIAIAGSASDLGTTVGKDRPDPQNRQHLDTLFSCGIAHVAADLGALIVDGGTHAGVMALIGQGVAEHGWRSLLLGVAPASKVSYPGHSTEGHTTDSVQLDANHTHVVLTPGDHWGDETALMYRLIATLADNTPAVTILVGGGPIAKAEIQQSVRLGLPIIIITGTGRLADQIAERWQHKRPDPTAAMPPAALKMGDRVAHPFTHEPVPDQDDPALSEIIEEGQIVLFPVDGDIAQFRLFLSNLMIPQKANINKLRELL